MIDTGASSNACWERVHCGPDWLKRECHPTHVLVRAVQVSRQSTTTRYFNDSLESPVDGRSFGVLLWELASGEVPRRGTLRELRCVPA